MPYINVHDAFYPHHFKDLKMAAKRGKILVITLVVSAGLVVLISTAIIRGEKDKKEADDIIKPSELRECAIAAANAGKQGLNEGTGNAIRLALETYAKNRHIDWQNGTINCSPNVVYNVGKDQVTVFINGDGKGLEIKAICGKIGATATANIYENTVQSSIFIS